MNIQAIKSNEKPREAGNMSPALTNQKPQLHKLMSKATIRPSEGK